MNIVEYLRKNDISVDEVIDRKLKEKPIKLPFNNRSYYGGNIKTKIADKISISNPKFWPKKGYFEKKNN